MGSIASPVCPDVQTVSIPSDEISSSSECEVIVQKEVTENHILLLPVEMREKIYTFLSSFDFMTLRLVCEKLRYEAEVFGFFNVTLPHHPQCLDTPIPFARLKTLSIDNDTEVLPWGECPTDTVLNLILTKVSFKTLRILGELTSPRHATLRSNVFVRPVPALTWTNLSSLRIKFFVPPDRAEEFMLDNLDTLLEQKFENLKSLSISMGNSIRPNLQSQYSIRVARFVGKHWLTLKDLHLTMEARRCVRTYYDYVLPSGGLKAGLGIEELGNFGKVQLRSLELNVSELSCPRCSVWRAFVQQQNELVSLFVNVSGAEKLPSDFFCNTTKLNQFCSLETLAIRLWGLGGYYPFDFRYFKSAKKLRYMELGRYPEARSQLTRPELLNVNCITDEIQTINITGFLISSEDVTSMLTRLDQLVSLALLDCGSGLDIGVSIQHVPALAIRLFSMLHSAMIDFNTEDPNPTRSRDMVLNRINQVLSPSHACHMMWKHLYDVGFHPCHRFEFRRYGFGVQLGGSSSSHDIFSYAGGGETQGETLSDSGVFDYTSHLDHSTPAIQNDLYTTY